MNNFNNILTKTESLTTLQGGIENSESGRRAGAICYTLASCILLRLFKKKLQNFTEKRRARSPQTTPKSTHALFTLKHYPFPSFTCCTLKIQFGNSQERFDNLTCPAMSMWNENLFLFVNHIPVIITKWILHVLP